MNNEDIICTCMSVSVKDIKKAMNEGAKTVQQVQDATGAGTVCGTCNELLVEIVEALNKENT